MTQKQKRYREKQLLGAVGAGTVAGGGLMGVRAMGQKPVHYQMYMGGNEGVTAKEIPPAKIAGFRRRVLNKQLPGYSMIEGKGYWTEAGKEASEPTHILDYIGKANESDKLRDVANSYGRVFKQSAVLMTKSPTTTRLLKPGHSQTLRALRRLMGTARKFGRAL